MSSTTSKRSKENIGGGLAAVSLLMILFINVICELMVYSNCIIILNPDLSIIPYNYALFRTVGNALFIIPALFGIGFTLLNYRVKTISIRISVVIGWIWVLLEMLLADSLNYADEGMISPAFQHNLMLASSIISCVFLLAIIFSSSTNKKFRIVGFCLLTANIIILIIDFLGLGLISLEIQELIKILIINICYLLFFVKLLNENGSDFYIFDFIKSIIRKGNIGVIIWLIINTALVTFLIGYIICMSSYHFNLEYPWAAYIIGFIVYIISIAIALSPIGEWLLRLQAGCKEIKRQDYLERLNPLFQEVYEKAKKRNPNLPDNIQFYMSEDEEPNAFATGRKTVCLTKGILAYSDEEIKAVLGHEFGHLAHKDTDAILVVQVGNLIVTGIFVVFRLLVNIITFIFHLVFSIISESFAEILISALTRVLIDLLLTGIMAIWTRLGVLICLSTSRKNEYEADEYSVYLGYGEKLCEMLDKLDSDRKGYGKKTLWAALNSSHPDTDKRIAHMQEIGVEYRK